MKRKFISWIIVVGLTATGSAFADTVSETPGSSKRKVTQLSAKDLARSLDGQRFGVAEQNKFMQVYMNDNNAPFTDIAVYEGQNPVIPPRLEGIPIGSVFDSPIPELQIQYMKAVDELDEVTRMARKVPFGPKLETFEAGVAQILQASQNDDAERLLRITLNRAVDLVHHILPVAGRNPDLIAQSLDVYYERMFDLARAFGNNPARLLTVIPLKRGTAEYEAAETAAAARVLGQDPALEGLSEESKAALRPHLQRQKLANAVHVSEFGRVIAEEMYELSQTLFTDLAQAVILMRIVGYLGYDLLSDPSRAEPGVAKLIVRVHRLQYSPAYAHLLESVRAQVNPDKAQLAFFRGEIVNLLRNEYRKSLAQAGIRELHSGL